MKINITQRRFVFILFIIPILVISAMRQPVFSQQSPLSLAEVLTGLQSRSSGESISTKNIYITQKVKERKVTFRLSSEITGELRRAGANTALVNAIRGNGPRSTSTRVGTSSAANVEFDRLWISYNVLKNGVKGMRVHAKFVIKNMRNTPLFLTVRFQKENGDIIRSSKQGYRNTGGQLAVFRKLTPAYNSSRYSDQSVFIPYREIVLPAGKHKLKVDADIIYQNGDFLKHLKLHPFVFTQPKKTTASLTAPRVKFTRMWIDHSVRQGGLLGMRVHTNMTVNNLLNPGVKLAIAIEKRDGSKVFAINSAYKSTNGQLTGYRKLNQKYKNSVYKDVRVFIPYSEFGTSRMNLNFKIHADILYPNKGNLHITYYDFILPGRTATNTSDPRVKFTRMWIDHNVRQGGLLGMRVHANITVYNLKDQNIKLAVAVEKRDGTKVFAVNSAYKSTNGQLTAYRKLNTRFVASVYRDAKVFIPYREFNTNRTALTFKIHADIIYPNKGNIHITYYDFILPVRSR